MSKLNYTINANENISKYEEKNYSETTKVYSLLKENVLSQENILWYQAWEGFYFLKCLSFRNEQLAAEIRRYIFLEILHGAEILSDGKVAFKTSDGKIFSDLKDKELLLEMAQILQRRYRVAGITTDQNANFIPINPQRFIEILRYRQIERASLIRLSFALGFSFEKFQRFLEEAGSFRQLSSAVPEELILIYCLQKKLPWCDVLRLQTKAREFMDQFKATPKKKYFFKLTETSKNLANTDENFFVEKILRQCCQDAAYKIDEDEQQFSATAWILFCENSILRDVQADLAGCSLPEGYRTNFLSDTVLRYAKQFPLGKYNFPTIFPSRILSQDMYCRFLNYRITMPNAQGRHVPKIFPMNCGDLPQEISKNILSYAKLINLPKRRHRINRHYLLIVIFYSVLMEHWREGKNSFIAESQAVADKLWKKFFNRANEVLGEAGYSTISSKNPMDLMLRIAMRSLCPLEIYSRICELNVISALCNGRFDAKKFPSVELIQRTLGELSVTYEHLFTAKIVDERQRQEVLDFIKRAQKNLPNLT